MTLSFHEFRGSRPDVLLVHLGGNDLGLLKGKALVIQVKEDLSAICQQWLGLTIVWSAMIPRLS